MDKEKPTNGELYQMVSGLQKLTTEKYKSLREMTDEKHSVQTGILNDIKGSMGDVIKMVRGISIEQQNLSREFDLMIKDFELYKMSTDSKINEHEGAIKQNTGWRNETQTWKHKIIGAAAVVSTAISLGITVAYVLNRNPRTDFEDLFPGMQPAEVQQAVELLREGFEE